MGPTFLERLAERQDELWNDARLASPQDRLLFFAARHPRFMTYALPVAAFVVGAWLF